MLAPLVSLALLLGPSLVPGDESPAPARLTTPWTDQVDHAAPLPEYPRPQQVREDWQNLNGPWQWAEAEDLSAPPFGTTLGEEILVPFPVESMLSGIERHVTHCWYRRSFEVPRAWQGRRVLLHFGAVDFRARVYVNGVLQGEHAGGYDRFTFDVTDALRGDGPQELVVGVEDPTSRGTQPRGKQVDRPHGIWYTATTGIWRTVWLEPVPTASIDDLHLVPDLAAECLHATVSVRGTAAEHQLVLTARADGTVVSTTTATVGEDLVLAVPAPRTWSPESPFLYDLTVELRHADRVVDRVTSYFGMRSIEAREDEQGLTRLFLNGEARFQMGLLDQGFWPDGLYTAPTDEALRSDIEVTKRLGYDLARKHVKVEPDRWYYWCDKLGLLVWQDMPSGDASVGPGGGEVKRSPESMAQFELELRRMIEDLRSHPSIVLWVVFNEGWGQSETERMEAWTRAFDPSRVVTGASGWNDFPTGMVHDVHVYPGPGMPEPEPGRVAILGEFGGLGLPLAGHTWQDEQNWGYRSFADLASLRDAYDSVVERLRPLIGRGLSAAIYTQTTDVEVEVNGVMTYDRRVVKLDEERARRVHARLRLPPPIEHVLLPTSQREPATWWATTERPAERWFAPDFDEKGWRALPGGFGTRGTPGAVVRSEWNTPDLWLRRSVELPPLGTKGTLHLRLHHDEDVEVYFNGTKVFVAEGYTTDYVDVPLTAEARATLHAGQNQIAVHCHQTAGGQYLDLGLVELEERQ